MEVLTPSMGYSLKYHLLFQLGKKGKKHIECLRGDKSCKLTWFYQLSKISDFHKNFG